MKNVNQEKNYTNNITFRKDKYCHSYFRNFFLDRWKIYVLLDIDVNVDNILFFKLGKK